MKTKKTRCFEGVEVGILKDRILNMEERKAHFRTLAQEFKARFPKARLDFFGVAEIGELLEYAKEVSPEIFKRYIEQKMTQALKDLEEAAALKLEKWRGLL